MNLIKKIIKHELVTGSFFIFVGLMFSNILAFFLNLFLARSLTYADYAIFASLSSVITLVSIPANSINTIIVKFATDYFINKENEKLKYLYIIFLKFSLGICIGIIILSFFISIPLASYLKLDNIWYVVVSGFAIAAYFLNILNSAFLQGSLRFKFLSLVNAAGGFFKLVAGVLLVFIGLKAFSGLWAIFFMTLGMFFVALFPLSKILKAKSSQKISLHSENIISYAIPAFIAVLFLTSFTSTDVILVKHFFNPVEAGYYGGLSLIGKVIFYFTFPIPMVMFPLLIKRSSLGISFNKLFYLALILVIIPSVFITALYFIRPALVINLFLGGREYLKVAPFLGIFGLNLTIFSLVNVFVNFFLSLNKTNVYIPVVIFSILQIVLIYLYHSNFYEIIGVSLFVLSLLLLVLSMLFIKHYTNFKRIRYFVPFLASSEI